MRCPNIVAITVARQPPAMRRMACRGTGTRRRLLAMALYMVCKSKRSWTLRRAVKDVAKVSFVLDQVSRPTASRRRREARRCSPPTPPTSLCSSCSVYSGTWPGSSWQRLAPISWAANQTRKSLRWMSRMRYAHHTRQSCWTLRKTNPPIGFFAFSFKYLIVLI
jgi:hypothetical protein